VIPGKNAVRRRRIGAVVTALGVVSLAACGGGSSGGGSGGGGGGDNGKPVTVSFELPLTGAFAANGKNEQNGFELGLDTYGRTVEGHPIQVNYVDTKGDPATALTSARQLVQNKTSIFEGPLVSSESAAVTPYLAQNKVPVDDLTLCSEIQLDTWQKTGNGYSSGWSCDQPALQAAEYAYKELGWRRVTLAGQDISFGWEVLGAFKSVFESLGGTVDQIIWVPANATDLSSYVSQVNRASSGVYAEMSGAFALKWTAAYQSFGLTGKLPLMGITQLTDQSVLPQEDRAAVTGVLTSAQYCDGIDTPDNQKFVQAYQAKFQQFPGYYSDAGYVKAQVVVSALKSLKGDVSDPKKVADALRGVAIQAPRGPVEISKKTYSPVQNVYICQVKEVDGKLRNVPIKTYEKVQPQGPLNYDAWEKHFRHDSAGRP
jgi:branched-chain amino acid transport system substrate-binding protein